MKETIRRKSSAIIIAGVVSILGLQCSKENRSREQINATQDLVTYSLKLEVNSRDGFSEEKSKLLDQINKGQPVSFKQITKELISEHSKNFDRRTRSQNPTNVQEAEEVVTATGKGISATADPSDIKLQYETNLEKRLGKSALYNRDAISIFDLIRNHKLQCFSGTIFQQVVIRSLLNPADFRNRRLVAIYESGHILPGFLVQENGGYHLYGIESTAKGKARIDYGKTNDLGNNIRIVDAEYFSIVELFKFHLKEPVEVANIILRQTAEKYGISNPFLVDKGTFRAVTDSSQLNWSPFSFGESNAPEGDRERSTIDTMRREDISGSNTNLPGSTVPLPTTPVVPPKIRPGTPPDYHFYGGITLPESDPTIRTGIRIMILARNETFRGGFPVTIEVFREGRWMPFGTLLASRHDLTYFNHYLGLAPGRYRAFLWDQLNKTSHLAVAEVTVEANIVSEVRLSLP